VFFRNNHFNVLTKVIVECSDHLIRFPMGHQQGLV